MTSIPTHYSFSKHLMVTKTTSFRSICKIWVALFLFAYSLTEQIVIGSAYLIFQVKQISIGWNIYLYDLTFLKSIACHPEDCILETVYHTRCSVGIMDDNWVRESNKHKAEGDLLRRKKHPN